MVGLRKQEGLVLYEECTAETLECVGVLGGCLELRLRSAEATHTLMVFF